MSRRMGLGLMVVLVALTSSLKAEVDTKPIAVKAESAFPNIRIDRPIVVTNAADGSNRLFVAGQKGKIHVFPNNQAVKKTKIFLDMSEKVRYIDRENEEGLLGMAFHPQYKKNGQFFVYYTTTDAPHTSVVSRFQVSKSDPNRAELSSEEELFRLKQPFWNHNGGTIAFGPDGYLYVGLGDGGKANDPFKAGQDLSTWHGSILRIDVDRKENGKNYAVPKDNPFVGKANAKPEIYAYGVRNIWRLSFDRETGVCWAGDVGQNLWEEINIITKGGNYGWNVREGKHEFAGRGVGAGNGLIEPIWEYNHNVGKSITGGVVYRGTRVPELIGHYLYADYVSGKIWALQYDSKAKKVVGNRPIASDNLPIITFGEDEAGDVYFTTVLGGGRLYRFSSTK